VVEAFTQGSSFVATLDWRLECLWDSSPEFPIMLWRFQRWEATGGYPLQTLRKQKHRFLMPSATRKLETGRPNLDNSHID